ncbi:MAG: T9SS type A sorting domain-containing protein [Bacteroidales bacterium]|nr:T9SS type A sorting domain-containing protein [Bacteroidales bacterium]
MKTINYLFIGLFLFLSVNMQAQKQLNNNTYVNQRELEPFDLSNMDWINAFDSLHAIMEERYPFTEWKGIDWEQKSSLIRPKIQIAQNETDTFRYCEALFEYVYSIPDGHVYLSGNYGLYKNARLGGSFGLNMIPITDGKIIANIVPENGPAYLAGIRCGDEILSWNGIPIQDIPEIEVYNYYNYATTDGRLLSRYQILSRDSVGVVISLEYISRETGVQQTTTLTSENDGFELFIQAHFLTAEPIINLDTLVFYETLDNQIGYLRILGELTEGNPMTIEEIRQTKVYLAVQEALTYFQSQSIDKLIIDLRFNVGGHDLLGSAISGFFMSDTVFYEYLTGTSDENYAIMIAIMTEPETPYFDGDVVAMVGPNCLSTGEGIPMIIRSLPNAQVISFWGTNGSFGLTGYHILMPDNINIASPCARSLNEDMVIQLDSDSTLAGGVQPDIKIPLTVERVIEQWQEGKDVELEYAKSVLLDIPEISNDHGFILFPNPASSIIHLKYSSIKPISIQIVDISGRPLKRIENFTTDQEIDISDLKTGLYFVYIINNQKHIVGKLLIK